MKVIEHAAAFASLYLLAACNHPLETNLSAPTVLQDQTFQLANTVENRSNAYVLAQQYIRDNLIKRGYRQADDGRLYVTITLSERDATSSVSIQKNDGEETISESTDDVFLKFCDDNVIKLSLKMHDIKDGSLHYKGTAAQRRCDIDEENSMRYLTSVALSNLLPIN